MGKGIPFFSFSWNWNIWMKNYHYFLPGILFILFVILLSDLLKCGATEEWWRKASLVVWKNEEVLGTVKEERKIINKIQWNKAEWIGRILAGTAF
jgi:hypothetical protein